MKHSFRQAPEVESLAQELIPLYHKHLEDLHVDLEIRYYFTDDTPKHKGKVVWGVAKKISGLNAAMAGSANDFFCIVITSDVWVTLAEKQKMALVDHELAHCWAEEKEDDEGNSEIVLSILPHDLEEFDAIARRYGPWRRDMVTFVKAFNESGQLQMILDG